MDGRSMLSSVAYCKNAEEKRQRESKMLQKIPRLDPYFSTKSKIEPCRPENAGEIKVRNYDNVEVENFGMLEGCVGSALSKAVDSAISVPSNDPFYWKNLDQTRDYLIT